MPVSFSKTLLFIILLSAGSYFNVLGETAADTISRDYVINLKGDTIKGQVISVNPGSVKIDPFSETHRVKFLAADIKEACQTGNIYIAIKPTIGFRDFIMAKRLDHGAIDLFEYVQGGYNGNYQTTWFAGNIKIPAAELKTSSLGGMSRADRRAHLLKLIADNEELTKEFEEKKDFSFEYLQDLITRYNIQAKTKGLQQQ